MSVIKFSRVEELQRAPHISGDARRGAEGERREAEKGERARRALIFVAFGAVYLIWGSTYLGIKYAIDTLPPFLMGGGRFLIAGAALIIWALVAGEERPSRAHWISAAVIGGLLFLGGNGGVVWAEQYIPSGLTALLVATEPLWVVLLNWARHGGTSPSGKTMIGLLIGFAGIWLLTGSAGLADRGGMGIVGSVVVIAAAFSWALGSVYTQRTQLPASPLLASGMQMLMGGALLTLAGTLSGEWTRLASGSVSALSISAFFYLIIFGSIIAFTAYSWLLRTVSPARAATYAYVNPIVAVILGWALASEPLTIRIILAAGVIVGSVVLINYGSQKRAGGSYED
jgi:drug/metabolite transporter (DMT)-like permease